MIFGEESAERDALLKAVTTSGLSASAQALPAADPAAVVRCLHPGIELILVACVESERLRATCATVRQAVPHAATLACLLAPRGRVPRLDATATRQLLREGADDLILGLPSAATVLTRMLTALRLAAARREGAQRARHQAALHEVLDLLLGRLRSEGELPEAVPVPIDSGASLGAERARRHLPSTSDALRSLSGEVLHQALVVMLRALESRGAEAVLTSGWSHVDLVLLDDDDGALTRLASASQGELAGRPAHHGAAPASATPQADAEVLAALRSGVATILEGARSRALLFPDRNAKESTVLVLPLPTPLHDGTAQGGALLLLCDEPVAQLDRGQGEFLQLCAQLLSLALNQGSVTRLALRPLELEGQRERTQRVTMPKVLSERRREAVLQYREFFEASADGMMVLDGRGEVYYFNRTAEQITGYAAVGLVQRSILELVQETQHRGLRRALQQAIDQVSLLPFDLQVTSTSGEELVLSASTSAVLAEHGLAVLSFRDVTQQRFLEGELRKTKDFLERLIDSTVDGIIAADLLGDIMLFNQGAARITGFSADEVIHKRKVWSLYPGGEAQRIMAAMRAADHGGPGRLSPSRRSLIGKDGTEIPVSLTASIIYEGGQEVATVGIFSDLRERLSIEQRLQQAQERLVQSERQAIIAELAGAAAHELNQPLTSVMGYAGLLRRKVGERASDLVDFVDTIVREAERMAEIVRKIGRITRYETKPYVGEARIIDLDRSAVPEPPPPDDLFMALSARKKDAP